MFRVSRIGKAECLYQFECRWIGGIAHHTHFQGVSGTHRTHPGFHSDAVHGNGSANLGRNQEQSGIGIGGVNHLDVVWSAVWRGGISSHVGAGGGGLHDGSPVKRQFRGSDSIPVLCIGQAVYRGVTMCGKAPNGAVYCIAKGIVRHDLPVVGGGYIQLRIRSVAIGSQKIQVLYDIGGGIVSPEVQAETIRQTAAGEPIQSGERRNKGRSICR